MFYLFYNEDHDTSLTLADFAKNVLGVTVKVSNQTLNQHGSYQDDLDSSQVRQRNTSVERRRIEVAPVFVVDIVR